MLNESSSDTKNTSEGRDERRRQVLEALRREADVLLERCADALVDLPDDQVFGQIEDTLRDLSHDFAARAHQAGIDAGKKKGATPAPASSAPTATTTPASSATGPRPG
jgi:hypothetical protein